MSLELVKDEVKVFIQILFKLFQFKYVFKYQMEDTNYVLSPLLSFYVVDYFCHFSFIRIWNVMYVYINAFICCLEIGLFFRTNMIVAQHGFIISFQLLGVVASIIVLMVKPHLLEASNRFIQFQWSLKNAKPEVKAAIGKIALFQCLMFALIIIVAYIDYLYIIKEINTTSIMNYIIEIDHAVLTNFVYLIELLDIWTICYFVLILPHIQIYFATAAQVQVFLLAQYVNDLTIVMNENSKENDKVFDKKMEDYLKCIISRYCEIKQVFLDKKKIFRSAGIYCIVPTALLSIFVIYVTVEGEISMITAVMHFLVFTCVLIFTMVAGQGFEDEWRNLYDSLCNLPWYTMNLSNQKMYLMLLIGSNQQVQLNLLPSIAVNYSLCIKMWKILYASANMIYNVHRGPSTINQF